jgi:hypothetical protein
MHPWSTALAHSLKWVDRSQPPQVRYCHTTVTYYTSMLWFCCRWMFLRSRCPLFNWWWWVPQMRSRCGFVKTLLEVDRTGDENDAQARTRAQRHVFYEKCLEWDGMLALPFALPCIAHFQVGSYMQSIWANSSPTTDRPCKLSMNFSFLVLHLCDDKQSNASPSTKNSYQSGLIC